jgi:hypothetical protein
MTEPINDYCMGDTENTEINKAFTFILEKNQYVLG